MWRYRLLVPYARFTTPNHPAQQITPAVSHTEIRWEQLNEALSDGHQRSFWSDRCGAYLAYHRRKSASGGGALVRSPYPCRRGSLPLGVALALGLAEIPMCSSRSRRSGISMDRGLWKMGRGRASGHFRSRRLAACFQSRALTAPIQIKESGLARTT